MKLKELKSGTLLRCPCCKEKNFEIRFNVYSEKWVPRPHIEAICLSCGYGICFKVEGIARVNL